MLLTLTATPPAGAGWPATDLGFLLHKNPERVQAFDFSYGKAHVLYPEATPESCTVALLLEVDPVALVRGKGRTSPDFALANYVNDRPYAASSLLASALGQVFRTALRGRCEQRPELAAAPLPLRVEIPALICREPELARRLFEPLGWTVEATPVELDPAFPEWGPSRYLHLVLTGTLRLADALSHLYVLLPTLDGAKHYWVSTHDVDKLVRAGGGWLGGHPERAMITRRYLARRQSLVREALARLAEIDDVAPEALDDAVALETLDDAVAPEALDDAVVLGNPAADTLPGPAPRRSLAEARRAAVLTALHDTGASRVLDLGCGEGALVRDLLKDKAFSEIVGVDVSARALQIAARKLRLDRLPERVAARLTLRQGALTYTDARLAGYDAAVLMEVIEHVDPNRLGALERSVFHAAKPAAVVVTTPNAEYNVLYETLEAGAMRHSDHRFEWTRAEFRGWAERVAAAHGYAVAYRPVGDVHPDLGPATQLALFTIGEDAGKTPKEVTADV